MKDKIMVAALSMVAESGIAGISRGALCGRVGVPEGSFSRIMGVSFTSFLETLAVECGVDSRATEKSRVSPGIRKQQLMNAATELSVEKGFLALTRESVAEHAGVSVALVSRYFHTMEQLKDSVMLDAVRHELLGIIAEGLAVRHPLAMAAPAAVRIAAAQKLGE